MFGISCPTTALCAAAGQEGQIITPNEPFAAESTAVHTKLRRPHTVITRHPLKRVKGHRGGAKVSFRFHATGAAAHRFECWLSGRRVADAARRAATD